MNYSSLISARTTKQKEYIRAITGQRVIFATGVAGTGKTSVAVGIALEHLINNKISKVVLTRPMLESSHGGIGYLPGNLDDKVEPYIFPLLTEAYNFLSNKQVDKLLDSNSIEVVPLELMRGRNFHHAYIVADEAQNATLEQLKLLLTRMGEDAKCIINGDMSQTDLPKPVAGGLKYCIDKLNHIEEATHIEFNSADIVRDDIVGKIIRSLECVE